MPITVLSNAAQRRAWARDPELSEAWVLCDEPSYADELRAQGVRFTALDDFSVTEHWDDINRWGAERALRFVSVCRERGFFKDTELPSVAWLFLSYILAQVLKNRFFAEAALLSGRADKVLAFEPRAPRWPGFSGNAFLNAALIGLATKRGVPVKIVPAGEARSMSDRPDVRSEKGGVGRAPGLRFRAQALYAALARPRRVDVVAAGGLRHVASIVEEAKRQGLSVGVYDWEFHIDQFRFAKKHGVPYFVPECFEAGKPDPTAKSDMPAAAAAAREEKIFVWKDEDWSALVEELVLAPLYLYEQELRAKIAHYRAAARVTGAAALVIDEDFAPKGAPLAAAFRLEGAKVFVPSHANLTVDFEVPARDRVFGSSTTFVQSEFEKEMYARRGWDASKIEVAGVPRYDGLAAAPRAPKRGPKRVLFCPGVLWPYSADNHAYAGVHFECYRDVTAPAFSATLRAAAGLPVTLVLKPHHAGLGVSYKTFVETEKSGARVEFLSHKRDLVSLMTGCDALVATYWSTAIVEAAIAGIPVIFVHQRPAVSPALEEFASRGFCRIVRDEASLREELAALCDGRERPARKEEGRYLGPRDGNAAKRFVERLRREISAVSAPPKAEAAVR